MLRNVEGILLLNVFCRRPSIQLSYALPLYLLRCKLCMTKHCADMNRGLLITLKCFSTRFAPLISSANHRLTLSQGKEKHSLKIQPLSFPRQKSTLPPRQQPQQVRWPKLPSRGHPSSPVSKDESASGEVQQNCIKLSQQRGHHIGASLHSFTCKVTVFIIFTRPASILLYWRLPFLLCQCGNKRIFSLWYKRNILPVLQQLPPLIKEN